MVVLSEACAPNQILVHTTLFEIRESGPYIADNPQIAYPSLPWFHRPLFTSAPTRLSVFSL